MLKMFFSLFYLFIIYLFIICLLISCLHALLLPYYFPLFTNNIQTDKPTGVIYQIWIWFSF